MRHGHKSIKKIRESKEHRSKYISNVAKNEYYELAKEVENSELAIDNSSFYNAYLANVSDFNKNPDWIGYDKMCGMLDATFEYRKKKSLENSLN